MVTSSGQSDAAKSYASAESTGQVPDNGSLSSEQHDPNERERTGETVQIRDDVVVQEPTTSDVRQYQVYTPTPPESSVQEEIIQAMGNELETSIVPAEELVEDPPMDGEVPTEPLSADQELDRRIKEMEAMVTASAALASATVPPQLITMNGGEHEHYEAPVPPTEDIVMSQAAEEALPLEWTTQPPRALGPVAPQPEPISEEPAVPVGAPGLFTLNGPLFPDGVVLPGPSLLLGQTNLVGPPPTFQNPAALRPDLSPFAQPITDVLVEQPPMGGDVQPKWETAMSAIREDAALQMETQRAQVINQCRAEVDARTRASDDRLKALENQTQSLRSALANTEARAVAAEALGRDMVRQRSEESANYQKSLSTLKDSVRQLTLELNEARTEALQGEYEANQASIAASNMEASLRQHIQDQESEHEASMMAQRDYTEKVTLLASMKTAKVERKVEELIQGQSGSSSSVQHELIQKLTTKASDAQAEVTTLSAELQQLKDTVDLMSRKFTKPARLLSPQVTWKPHFANTFRTKSLNTKLA